MQIGEQDARYIRRMIMLERGLDMAGRIAIVLALASTVVGGGRAGLGRSQNFKQYGNRP